MGKITVLNARTVLRNIGKLTAAGILAAGMYTGYDVAVPFMNQLQFDQGLAEAKAKVEENYYHIDKAVKIAEDLTAKGVLTDKQEHARRLKETLYNTYSEKAQKSVNTQCVKGPEICNQQVAQYEKHIGMILGMAGEKTPELDHRIRQDTRSFRRLNEDKMRDIIVGLVEGEIKSGSYEKSVAQYNKAVTDCKMVCISDEQAEKLEKKIDALHPDAMLEAHGGEMKIDQLENIRESIITINTALAKKQGAAKKDVRKMVMKEPKTTLSDVETMIVNTQLDRMIEEYGKPSNYEMQGKPLKDIDNVIALPSPVILLSDWYDSNLMTKLSDDVSIYKEVSFDQKTAKQVFDSYAGYIAAWDVELEKAVGMLIAEAESKGNKFDRSTITMPKQKLMRFKADHAEQLMDIATKLYTAEKAKKVQQDIFTQFTQNISNDIKDMTLTPEYRAEAMDKVNKMSGKYGLGMQMVINVSVDMVKNGPKQYTASQNKEEKPKKPEPGEDPAFPAPPKTFYRMGPR